MRKSLIDTLKKHQTKLIFLSFSFILMLFFSESSPLFWFNSWVDSNYYMTVARGMQEHQIIYKDMFEQKGPLLFFIHYFAIQIFGRSFIGIYFLESIFLFINFYFIFKISNLFLKKSYSYFTVALFPLIFFNFYFFEKGDSAEELCFPIILYVIYLSLQKAKENILQISFSKIQYFALGLGVAWIFWIKFSILGIVIGFYFGLLLWLLFQKNWRELLKAFIYSFLGFISLTIPILLYFIINHAIGDLFFAYFYSNIVLYPTDSRKLAKLISIPITFGSSILKEPLFGFLTITGIASLLFSKIFIKTKPYFWHAFSLVLFTILGAYAPLRAHYYYMPIVIFTIIGGITILYVLEKNIMIQMNVPKIIMLFLLSISLTFGFNDNIHRSKLFTNSPPTIKIFGDIIKKDSHSTVLTYHHMDIGIYYFANKGPDTKYYSKWNIPESSFPIPKKQQEKLIAKKQFTYVVVPEKELKNLKNIKQNYKMIKSIYYDPYGTFLLFKAR